MGLELDTLLETAVLGSLAAALTAPVPITHQVSRQHPDGTYSDHIEPGYTSSPLVAAVADWFRTDDGKAWLGRAFAEVLNADGFIETVRDACAEQIAKEIIDDRWHRQQNRNGYASWDSRKTVQDQVAVAVGERVVEAVDELIRSTVANHDVADIVESRMGAVDLNAVSIEVKLPSTEIEVAS